MIDFAALRAQARANPLFRYGMGLAALVFVLDQISKYLVLGLLQFSPPGCREQGLGCGHIDISPFFDLRMVWNLGISFGLFRAETEIVRWLLVLVAFAIAGFFGWWLLSASRRLTAIALGLVVGGALGNVIDRIRFGAVADFLDFNGLWFPWVFNVADAGISVGAVLLAADFLLHGEEKAPGKTGAGDTSPQNGQDRG